MSLIDFLELEVFSDFCFLDVKPLPMLTRLDSENLIPGRFFSTNLSYKAGDLTSDFLSDWQSLFKGCITIICFFVDSKSVSLMPLSVSLAREESSLLDSLLEQ
jgi:hypothetical protein